MNNGEILKLLENRELMKLRCQIINYGIVIYKIVDYFGYVRPGKVKDILQKMGKLFKWG